MKRKNFKGRKQARIDRAIARSPRCPGCGAVKGTSENYRAWEHKHSKCAKEVE